MQWDTTLPTAALRDFSPLNVRYGSILSNRRARDALAMSALLRKRTSCSARKPRLGGRRSAHLRWTRMLLGRGAGYPLLRGGCGFRPVRGCRNRMNDLVAAAFELVENFGQREDGAGVNVVQQQDAPAARLDTADGASRNLAIVDAGPVVRQEI